MYACRGVDIEFFASLATDGGPQLRVLLLGLCQVGLRYLTSTLMLILILVKVLTVVVLCAFVWRYDDCKK